MLYEVITVINILVLAGLMALGYFCGSWTEKRHYRDIEAREQATARIQATNAKNIRLSKYEVEFAEMVSGNVVIGLDYFKMIIRITSYNVCYTKLLRKARDTALVNWYKAAIYAAAGNSDEALEWLEVALDKEFRDFVNLENSKYFASLRNDPRYKALVDRYR